MATTTNTSLQNRLADSWGADLDSGFLDIYTGSQPGANDAPTGSLLVSIPLNADAFDTANLGVANVNGAPSATASATGTAAYAQLRNAGNTRWQYGSVTATGGGGAVQLNALSLTSGVTVVTVSSGNITAPAS